MSDEGDFREDADAHGEGPVSRRAGCCGESFREFGGDDEDGARDAGGDDALDEGREDLERRVRDDGGEVAR